MSADPGNNGNINSPHSEGVSYSQNQDGSIHETKWYDNGYGSSARTSRDIDPNGNVSDEHTTVQKRP